MKLYNFSTKELITIIGYLNLLIASIAALIVYITKYDFTLKVLTAIMFPIYVFGVSYAVKFNIEEKNFSEKKSLVYWVSGILVFMIYVIGVLLVA